MLIIDNLAQQISNCTNCRLAVDRGKGLTVPASPGSNYQTGGIAVFLEAPGADEERQHHILASGTPIGKPLVGLAGQLMDQLLDIAGVPRKDVLVLNRIRCRPPRNRIDDYPDAVSQCDPWVIAELAAYNPSIIILSGNTALKSVFGANASITSSRGIVRSTSAEFAYGARVWVPTFHPSYALRNGGLQSSIAQDIISDIQLAKDMHGHS